MKKERTPSPGRLSAVRARNNNNNNKERTPSPKHSGKSRETPGSGCRAASFPKAAPVPQGQGSTRRPSSFPAAAATNGEEDVNVKERAAIFGPRKGSGRGKLAGKNLPGETSSRKKSESASSAGGDAPGSPSKIKNMAALFENA